MEVLAQSEIGVTMNTYPTCWRSSAKRPPMPTMSYSERDQNGFGSSIGSTGDLMAIGRGL
jgi:hypothetical protein